MKRRSFLRVAALPAVINSFTVRALAGGDPLLHQLLEEQDRVLILIQMQGGNDGLNTVIPYTDPLYYQRRPTIGIPKAKALRINDSLGWHPALRGFRDAFDAGNLAVIQGVTYPNPDRSHFRGTDIWLTATDADVFGTTGWIGRYLQSVAPQYPTELPAHPLAIQIGTSVSLGMLGTAGPMGITFRDPDEFYRLVNGGGGNDEVPSSTQSDTPVGREVAFMRSIARSADVYAAVVKQANDKAGAPSGSYPATDIGAKLRVVSQLIRGGLQSRVYLISWANNNFDTHANQTASDDSTRGAHATLLAELGDAVSSFMADMKQQGHDKRIAGMTFSEFGRRVAENGSVGTDHGTAAPLFVFGSSVNGGVYGANPNLTNLDERGDLLMEYDYRNIYTSVLLQWFGTSPTLAQQLLLRDMSANAPQIFKTPTSIQDHASTPSAFIRVSPQPASDILTIRARADVGAQASVTLSDLRGRVLLGADLNVFSSEVTLDVRAIPAGAYVVSLTVNRAVTHTIVHIQR